MNLYYFYFKYFLLTDHLINIILKNDNFVSCFIMKFLVFFPQFYVFLPEPMELTGEGKEILLALSLL